MAIDIRGTLAPLTAVARLFQEPITLTYPQTKREYAKGYRGFHINKLDACIGCANCQDVCMNDAIDMIKADEQYCDKNTANCIPRIDYGRCCWCSLCTDVCPTESLKLESDCVYADSDPDNFLYMPKNKEL